MPLPLGSVGVLLRSSDADHLHRIFTFMETTVSLAISYGLAVAYRTGRWSIPPADLRSALDQASLGTRAQLFQQLDCGWDLRATSDGFRGVVELALGKAQLPKRGDPSVAQALQALVAARNQLAHPTIPKAIRSDAAAAVVDGVVALARTNRWFGYRLLRAEGFATTPEGRPGVIATSMTGLHPSPYRGHAPIHAPEVHSVGELFLYREDGALREVCLLSPFVVARGKHVYFLADYRKGRPVMWCSSVDAPPPDDAMIRDVEAVLGAGALRDVPVAAARMPDATPDIRANVEALASSPSGIAGRPSVDRGSRKGLVMGVALVGVLVAAALVVAFVASDSPEPMVFDPLDTPMGAPSSPSAAPSSSYDRDEALWALLGLEVRFGASASALTSTGRVGAPRGPECGGATWRSYDVLGHGVPAATGVRAWVDDELGLVEVTATSDASPADLMEWVERRLGRAPTGRSARSARWCLGARGVSVAIDRHGRPMLRVVHEGLRSRFGEKRRASCPDEYAGGGPYQAMCPIP